MTLYSWVCLGCDTNISIRDCLYCIWNVADVSRLFYCRKLSLPGDEWRSNQLWYVQIILSFHDIFTFWILLRFPRKYDIGFDLPSSCLWEGSCHIYVICVCLRIVVSNAYCAMFLFFFVLVLGTLCWKFLWIVHFSLPLYFSVFSNVYSAWGSYHDFRNKELLLTKKLLNTLVFRGNLVITMNGVRVTVMILLNVP